MPFFPLARVTVNGISYIEGTVEGVDYDDAVRNMKMVAEEVQIYVDPNRPSVGYGGGNPTFQLLNCPTLTKEELEKIFSKEKRIVEQHRKEIREDNQRVV